MPRRLPVLTPVEALGPPEPLPELGGEFVEGHELAFGLALVVSAKWHCTVHHCHCCGASRHSEALKCSCQLVVSSAVPFEAPTTRAILTL